ncbi:MAG: S41 family peptidase [Nitrospinaceae bacterium]
MFGKKFKIWISGFAIVLLSILFAGPIGNWQPNGSFLPTAQAGFFNNDLELFDEVVDLVSEKFVYPPDYKKLFSAAIDQMLTKAGKEGFKVQKTSQGRVISSKNYQVEYDLNYDPGHDLESFKKVYHFLLAESRNKFSKEDMEVAGISGIMNSLDPYSQYLDKDAFDKSMRDTEGKYGGLGMIVTMKDDQLLVVKTMRNGPARRAGILPNDSFVKVNGQNVRGMQITELAEMLRGYPNTKVTITLLRAGGHKEQTYTLTREIISIETVSYETLKDAIGYIKITSFSKQTNDQLKKSLAQAKQDGVKAFILDLRDNPGGLLNQSVKVASHFLYRGRLIVYTQGRRKADYKEYRAHYKNSLLHMPVVILINRHSASASEIVAGALRDSGKALIIGENSYGKGSVQTIFRISDGSGLRLTTSKYYTPSGIDITKHGIVPEIKIVKEIGYEDEADTGAPTPSIRLKEADLDKFLSQKGLQVDEEHDSSLRFAHMVLRNMTIANRKETLARAREIAANIHF